MSLSSVTDVLGYENEGKCAVEISVRRCQEFEMFAEESFRQQAEPSQKSGCVRETV